MVFVRAQHFTIKMQEGVLPTAYALGDKFFIDPYKLLPMDRFLPQPKGATAPRGGGRGGEKTLVEASKTLYDWKFRGGEILISLGRSGSVPQTYCECT